MYAISALTPIRRYAVLGALLLMICPLAHAQERDRGESDYRTYKGPEQQVDVPAEIPAYLEWGTGAWGVEQVEHLFNRAGFGARSLTIKRWARRSREQLVEHLFEGGEPLDPFLVQAARFDRRAMADMSKEERKRFVKKLKTEDKRQFREYVSWWLESMLRGQEPLRDKMTLFWSGLFTSSVTKVKRSSMMIAQNQILREGALDNYADLLREMLRDPAMLVYLDGDSNRRGQPNENLAREALELFSLGEGNYTEEDVREAARALTGRGVDRQGYRFMRADHDQGPKVILGRRARFGGDGLVDVLLSQDACPRYIAGRIITWFEGVEPSADRLADYAAFLAQENYAITPFLQRLFTDPAFYREEIIGARVLGPVEYAVSSCRRLGLEPPPGALAAACTQLGQSLMDPPNVKGWEEGVAWISTSTLMARGNIMGVLLGALSPDDFLAEAAPEPTLVELDESLESELDEAVSMDDEVMDGGDVMDDMAMSDMDMAQTPLGARPDRSANGGAFKLARYMDRLGYTPRLNLGARLGRAGRKGDEAIVDALAGELLAIPLPAETRALLLEFMAQERELRGLQSGRLRDRPYEAEQFLRDLAHLILSLPEAQLG